VDRWCTPPTFDIDGQSSLILTRKLTEVLQDRLTQAQASRLSRAHHQRRPGLNLDPQTAEQLLTYLLKPWHESLENPAKAQEAVFHRNLQDYARTEYGKSHGAGNIESLQDYRRLFPVATYEDYKPLIEDLAGEPSCCLGSVGRAITRAQPAANRVHSHDATHLQ
jgi:hypothetical protein